MFLPPFNYPPVVRSIRFFFHRHLVIAFSTTRSIDQIVFSSSTSRSIDPFFCLFANIHFCNPILPGTPSNTRCCCCCFCCSPSPSQRQRRHIRCCCCRCCCCRCCCCRCCCPCCCCRSTLHPLTLRLCHPLSPTGTSASSRSRPVSLFFDSAFITAPPTCRPLNDSPQLHHHNQPSISFHRHNKKQNKFLYTTTA